MTLRLKPGVSFAPDGYPFTDPRTGFKVCGYQLSIDGAVSKLIDHRRANPSKYPASEPQWTDFSTVKQEYLRHLHGQKPELFRPSSDAVVASPVMTNFDGEQCPQCGSTDLDIQRCVTCGGNKLLSKKCRTCGYDFLKV